MSESFQNGNKENLPDRQSVFQFIPYNSSNPNNTENSGTLDPKRILAIILRFKWLILILLVLGATSAWFYADSLTPIYESHGTILISSSDATNNEELSQIISQATGYGTSTTLANELQVLRSRKFSRQVAKKLIEENQEGFEKYPVLWTEDEESGKIYRSDEDVVVSRIQRSIDFRQIEKESDVVEVSFRSPSPDEAALIVNTAMKIYVENSTQQNRQAAESTAEFLEEEKEEIKQKLRAAEESLRRYMDSTGIVRVDEQASGMVDQRAETEAELQRVNLELETINQTIEKYENQLEKIKPGLSEQFSEAIGPRIRNAQEELARYERERTMIISKNPGVLEREPVPPRLKNLNEQIENLKGEIKNLSDKLFTDDNNFMGLDGEDRAEMVAQIQGRLVDLRIERNQYMSRREALQQHKEEMDSSFDSLPEGMIELAKLKRDVRINEELYMSVSRQYADMSVLKQSQFGFGRIIDPGEIPGSPVSPNKKLLLIVGILLGGLVSAAIITIKDFMDDSVSSMEQLRNLNNQGISLSAIPTIDENSDKYQKSFKIGSGKIPKELVLLRDRSSIVAESFRRIKNNIIYQNSEELPKTITVTSPEKGDGKTSLVANLGIAFAEEGYKTLIIDTDFRRPRLHKYFGLMNNMGLSEILEKKKSIHKVIQNSDINTLKVITAGRTQRTENLVSKNTFKEFLNKMEEIFDVILLDTSPFGIISDSTALLKRTEATILVVRHRKTNMGIFLKTLEDLDRIQAKLIGIVLNDFDHRKEYGNYYGAGYYNTLYENYEEYID